MNFFLVKRLTNYLDTKCLLLVCIETADGIRWRGITGCDSIVDKWYMLWQVNKWVPMNNERDSKRKYAHFEKWFGKNCSTRIEFAIWIVQRAKKEHAKMLHVSIFVLRSNEINLNHHYYSEAVKSFIKRIIALLY